MNPLDMDWEFKADWIQCRADAVDCAIFDIEGMPILALDEKEARQVYETAKANKQLPAQHA